MIHGIETAHRLAIASRDAYAPPAGATVIGDGLCNAHITRQGFDVIIAFQGTNEGADWWSNLDRHMIPLAYGWVHQGFHDSLAWLAPTIYAAANIQPQESVWITGHSRGGAHALLFAAWMVWHARPISGAYTFGSPRVGDWTFKAWADAHIPGHHRYVHQSDLVARLPHFGYEHCGTLHWHDGHEWRRRMPIISRIGVWIFGRHWPLIGDELSDHSIDRYIEALHPDDA